LNITTKKEQSDKKTAAEDQKERGQMIFCKVIRQQKFEGRCNSLKGHIFNCEDAKIIDKFRVTHRGK